MPEEVVTNLAPTPKVAAAGAGGALAVVMVWMLSLVGISAPGEVGAAIATLGAYVAGWLRREGESPHAATPLRTTALDSEEG